MKPNAVTYKRNYKQDFDNQLAMFYPGFQRLSFSYLQLPLQVRFNILSQVFWEWISGARVALSGNEQPIALLSPRTVSTRRGPRVEPVTSVQKVDRGGQIERAKNKGQKRDNLLSFLLRASPYLNAWNFAIHFITD